MKRVQIVFLMTLAGMALWLGQPRELSAARISDVRSTKHNLSVTGPGTVKATSETQVCVFCHTPHGAEDIPAAPLWNRKASTATYTPYSSSSIEANIAEMAAAPGGSSKLCLSCHDGTIAIGNVNVLNGSGPAVVNMTGTGAGGVMPPGSGTGTGFTRNLGSDLSNDHPISFTYDAALATADGELRAPDGTSVGTRLAGVRPAPKMPLESGQMQCATCHDPHLHENDPAKQPGKFLRANRLQEVAPTGSTFSEANDQICLACHDKGGQTWAQSAHANPAVANELYKPAAAAQREFPANIPVWKAACLNCHDTHSVQGSRRLLREGTDSLASPKSGGNSAIEETCYQCHRDTTGSILQTNTEVPNIRDDYNLPGGRHMPITNLEQGDNEVHDIGTNNPDATTQRGKDFIESRTLLGHGNLGNRHAECTDCHNPHRVQRNRLFNGTGAVDQGTHVPGGTLPNGGNIASGVLRGTWGVEPDYGAVPFRSLPDGYFVKRGDPGTNPDTTTGAAYVTREYQICLKCHSDYGYLDDGLYPSATRPSLGAPGTPSGTNAMTRYTNQAMEFQAPGSHKANAATTDSGATDPPGALNYQTNNRRSWHPVIDNTGRIHALRNTTAASFLAPWQTNVGNQTMYCTDCHGSSTAATTITPSTPGTGPQNPWGPHGSTNNFILKGNWSQNTGSGTSLGVPADANALCFKCHDTNTYSATSGGGNTGFFNPDSDKGRGNLHQYHREKIGRIRCTWCHIAVPHGWKNKMFLVNLNDVGLEAGLAQGTQVRNNTKNIGYTNGPYYLNAMLKIRAFAPSGAWLENSCGSAGAPGNGEFGRDWMRDSTESCNNPP